MSFDEHRDAVKICVIQDECQQMTNGPICDDEEDCFEASGQNEIETTTMFTSIKQLTEITRNECWTDTQLVWATRWRLLWKSFILSLKNDDSPSPTIFTTTSVTLYDAYSGSNDGSDGDSEDSKSDDNEDESAYKSDSSDLDSELDYDSEMPVTFTKIFFC